MLHLHRLSSFLLLIFFIVDFIPLSVIAIMEIVVQDITTFAGTMLEVKKTHVLIVLDPAASETLASFIKGAYLL